MMNPMMYDFISMFWRLSSLKNVIDDLDHHILLRV